MKIEIDQSGKISDTKIATALAFSNKISSSIYLPAVTKRKLIQNLRTRENSRVFYFRLFSVMLFLLLRDYLPKIEQILIDIEYPGWESQIKAYLLDLCLREKIALDSAIISFTNIGKKSKAHLKAITSLRQKRGDKRITYQEIVYLFLPKKKDRGPYR